MTSVDFTWRACRNFYRWIVIFKGALAKPTCIGRGRNLAHAAGRKKFEQLCDWVIRTRLVGQMLPLLEAILAGRGGQADSQSSPVKAAGNQNRALSKLAP